MIRPILRYGERPLHQPAADVATFDDDLQRLIDDMIETMYAAPGIGLAATQIGVPLRVFVVDISVGRERDGLIVMVNPAFRGARRHAARRRGMPECAGLQRDGRAALSARCSRASIAHGVEHTVEGKGLLARAFQHEMDHLDGVAVHRSPARNQAGPHRPADSEAETQRPMVTPRSGQRLRIVYFGTPEFAVPTLQRLA